MLVEVPHFKDIPTEVTPNLQEKLNGVTDVMARVSKLVHEDLDRAVSTALGQDKQGKLLRVPALSVRFSVTNRNKMIRN